MAPSLQTVVASLNRTIVLPCRTESSDKISWSYRRNLSAEKANVIRFGLTLDGFEDQFALQVTRTGGMNLFIKDVRISNNGLYTCTENGGLGEDIVSYSLNVQGFCLFCSTDRCHLSIMQ